MSLMYQEESFMEGTREDKVMTTVLWSDQEIRRIVDERSRGVVPVVRKIWLILEKVL